MHMGGGGETRRSHVSRERAWDRYRAATSAGRTGRQAALVSSSRLSPSLGNLGGRPRVAHTSGEVSFGFTRFTCSTKVGNSGIKKQKESALPTEVDCTSQGLEESAHKHCVTMHLQARERPPAGCGHPAESRDSQTGVRERSEHRASAVPWLRCPDISSSALVGRKQTLSTPPCSTSLHAP